MRLITPAPAPSVDAARAKVRRYVAGALPCDDAIWVSHFNRGGRGPDRARSSRKRLRSSTRGNLLHVQRHDLLRGFSEAHLKLAAEIERIVAGCAEHTNAA
jgi:hypothetical protein